MQLSPFAGDQECWKKHYGDNWNIIQSFINRHVYSLQYCFHTCTFTTRFMGLVSRPEAKQRNKAIAIFHPRHFHCFVERTQRYERPKKSDWQQHDAFKPQRRLVIIIIIIIQLLDCFKFRVPQFRPKQYGGKKVVTYVTSAHYFILTRLRQKRTLPPKPNTCGATWLFAIVWPYPTLCCLRRTR